MTDLFRFTGTDGSANLETGKVYLLRLGIEWNDKLFKAVPTIHFVGGASREYIPYTTWNMFLENWERVK